MIPIYIFSYNRADCLQNAIHSVEKFFPYSEIHIVDDNSDNTDMIKYLLNTNHKVTVRNNPNEYRGGLWYNLNFALQDAKQNNYDYVFFMQDDEQIVREYEELSDDIEYLKNNNTCFSISPTFFNLSEKHVGMEQKVKLEGNYYVPVDVKQQCQSTFIDVGLFDVNKFIDNFGEFKQSEQENQLKALELGMHSSASFNPILSRLPFQRFERRGRNPRAIELINQIAGMGFNPFNDMNPGTITCLKERNRVKYPYAEDWLISPNVMNREVWSFWGETFAIELSSDLNKKDLARKLFWIEQNVHGEEKDEKIIEICEQYLRLYDSPNKYS